MFTAFADSEYGHLREVLLCPPGNTNAGAANIAFSDLHLAIRQHENLVATLQEQGVQCHILPADPATPYQTYMRDSFIATPWGLLLARMGFQPREAEPELVENFAIKVGMPVWKIAEGSLECGDIQLLRPGYAVIGANGKRTTAGAALQSKGWFENRGWSCQIVQYPPQYRHLDTALSVIDANNIFCCEKALSTQDLDRLEVLNFRLHFVPNEETANMICNTVSLGQNRILSCSQNVYGNKFMEKLGFEVLEVDISQFVRDSGGIHCLVNPILRDPSRTVQPNRPKEEPSP